MDGKSGGEPHALQDAGASEGWLCLGSGLSLWHDVVEGAVASGNAGIVVAVDVVCAVH